MDRTAYRMLYNSIHDFEATAVLVLYVSSNQKFVSDPNTKHDLRFEQRKKISEMPEGVYLFRCL